MTRCASPFIFAASLLACDVTSADPSDAGDGERFEVDAIAAFASLPPPPPLAAAGWIELDGSPIVPWCGAVLVAPDVAMTTASCVVAWDPGFLRIGFGEREEAASIAIERVLLQKDAAVPELALAALQLAEPVSDVAPVELTSSRLRREICGVASVSYSYVLVDDDSSRWSWKGCVAPDDEAWLVARNGAPNCHGDLGAGAFVPDGALLGIVVDAFSEGGCTRDERVATVADNEAFFTAALDLSRP